VGSSNENKSLFSGGTTTYSVVDTVAIKGTSAPTYFRSHRSAKTLKYTIPGFTSGAFYSATLGLAEIYRPNCMIGKRIMSIKLNNITVTSNLDVFKAVGCETAYMETHVIPANAQGVLVIEIAGVVENAMLSYISVARAQDRYFLDIGAIGDNIKMVQGTTTRYGDANTPEIAGTRTPVRFRTHRFGSDFKYVIESGFTPGRVQGLSVLFRNI
jgi:Malectin domain